MNPIKILIRRCHSIGLKVVATVSDHYDGANVMTDALNGLQAKIKNDAPNTLLTHCHAHHLNLVLQDVLNV